ncbi:hypothetical protein DC345_00365 [Paenibacillus taichungensis]|uniref:CSD domain-containing protein n=1 Tax=Paenibacillus taichungensis TaxID=484184 RepID=A0A329R5W2_9BACL|nr:hypothetical protein DC345_00365 [Paenibacillus taichungensis]
MRGTVIRYSDYKGYGFIKSQDSNENYFVHISQISGDGFRTLIEGQVVEFEPYYSNKGWQARDVHRVTLHSDEEPIFNDKLKLKKNPFTPQYPVNDPLKFAGRKHAFMNAIDGLFNNKNILISGPRGIGKSSISNQLLLLTQGDTTLLNRLNVDLDGYVFNYLSGDYRCVPGNSLNDLIDGLLSSLKINIGKIKTIKDKKYKVELNFKFIKAGMESSEVPLTPTELSTLFVAEVENIYREFDHQINGICLLIDEIDVLEDKVDIAPFLKSVIEKFKMDNFINISFLVSGVTGITTSLIAQHQSSTRLFEILELQRMTDSELSELMELTLDGTGVDIIAEAKSKILSLSNRFPQPVHLLGYHSFRVDDDNIINLDDVEQAKDFIVQNLRRQEFNSKLEKLGKGAISEILKVLATSQSETINISYLYNRLPNYKDDEIAGNLGNLEKWDIIEKQHRGVYRFKEPLFKIYIRWIFGVL